MAQFFVNLASVLFFVGIALFIVFSLIIYKLNKQLIVLGTYEVLTADLHDIAIQHENYLTLIENRKIDTKSIDQDVFMSIYLSGKYDGLSLALTKNKIEVEKILQKNLNE